MVVANNGITMTKNKGELLAILIANQMWQDKAHLPMEHIQGFTWTSEVASCPLPPKNFHFSTCWYI